jgi:hypothetical protein
MADAKSPSPPVAFVSTVRPAMAASPSDDWT